MGAEQSLPLYDPNDFVNDKQLDLNPANYAKCGLYLPFEAYDNISVAELAQHSQEEQMKYADAISRRYAKNPIFLLMQERSTRQVQRLSDGNTCGLGNLALLAYHNPGTIYSDLYERLMAEAASCEE